MNSVVERIKHRNISIYDLAPLSDLSLWIPTHELQSLLNAGLSGLSLANLPLRTRSKVLKSAVCKVLGYPVPMTFKKTQPRFLGQDFDIYSQKSNNLQIWNEEIGLMRRYAIIRIAENDVIERVKVIHGRELALMDTTGTLTRKYQARINVTGIPRELVSKRDTERIEKIIVNAPQKTMVKEKAAPFNENPVAKPQATTLFSIEKVFDRLSGIVGESFKNIGIDQERNRGSELNRIICNRLGYRYQDNGQFPDICHQLLEIKLQTSPTIDLGLVEPSSEESLNMEIDGTFIRHCDVRYAIFYANTDGNLVTITHCSLVTGKDFFSRFPRFEGKVINQKIQIPLPRDFFTR